MYDHLLLTEKSQSGYAVSTGSGQTLQRTTKIPGSAEIMRNQLTEPIVAYLSLRYLVMYIFSDLKKNRETICDKEMTIFSK